MFLITDTRWSCAKSKLCTSSLRVDVRQRHTHSKVLIILTRSVNVIPAACLQFNTRMYPGLHAATMSPDTRIRTVLGINMPGSKSVPWSRSGNDRDMTTLECPETKFILTTSTNLRETLMRYHHYDQTKYSRFSLSLFIKIACKRKNNILSSINIVAVKKPNGMSHSSQREFRTIMRHDFTRINTYAIKPSRTKMSQYMFPARQ